MESFYTDLKNLNLEAMNREREEKAERKAAAAATAANRNKSKLTARHNDDGYHTPPDRSPLRSHQASVRVPTTNNRTTATSTTTGTAGTTTGAVESSSSSPISTMDYEYYIEYETNRAIVLQCIKEEQESLTKESLESKAYYKGNLGKAQVTHKRNMGQLQRAKVDHSKSKEFLDEATSMLQSLDDQFNVEQEQLKCQILNLTLLQNYFVNDVDWKEKTPLPCFGGINLLEYFETSLFGRNNNNALTNSAWTKREVILLRHRLEHIQHLYEMATQTNRKSLQRQAMLMKMDAIQKFNRINGIGV